MPDSYSFATIKAQKNKITPKKSRLFKALKDTAFTHILQIQSNWQER
jgi:hypothetical protein